MKRIPCLIAMLATLCAAAHGAVTRVRIEGMRPLAAAQALESLGGRLSHVRASAPSPSRADDAAFLLRQLLRRDGHADATVAWRVSGRDEITLTVDAGVRRTLGKVSVRGTGADDAQRFAKLFAKPAEKDRALRVGPPPFREADIPTGLAAILQDLQARGYWSATTKVASRQEGASNGEVRIVLEVNPGPLCHIATPVVTSIDGRGVKLATGAAVGFVGRPATTKQLNAMRFAVEEAVLERGYPEAHVRMTRGAGDDCFTPRFELDLGTRVKLRKLDLAGIQRTDPRRITARLDGMPGTWYDQSLMNQRIREFLATGAFSSARVETREVAPRVIDATLHFEEARAREAGLAVGYGSYQGPIVRGTLIDRNWFGKLWGMNAGVEISARGLLGDVRVTDPWAGGSDVAVYGRGYALIYSRDGYDSYDSGGELGAIWKPAPAWQLELLGGLSAVNVQGDGLPRSELGETLYLRPRVRFVPTLDLRDNPVLPEDGWHVSTPLELGAAVGSVSSGYMTAGLNAGWFRGFSRKWRLGLGGEWGVLVPTGAGTELPIDLRLFNGGSRSVRSFGERELGPSADGHPTGGQASWSANIELTREIGGLVKAVGFVDAGRLAETYGGMGDAKVEIAPGAGLRVDLPIGPVRLEYGYNATRDSGEPRGTLHFAIGHAF